MSFGLLLFTACSKEEDNNQNAEQAVDSVLVLKENNGTLVWETMEVKNSTNENQGRANSAHTHGDYTGFGGGVTISFSGTENNGGAHGSAEVRQESGPFVAHYLLETTSVVVEGNYAIYGGIITEVLVNSFPPPPPPPPGAPAPPCSPNSVGNYVYFTVYDNGQGSNAPADQYRGLFQSCAEQPNGAYNFPWFIFGSPSDVMNESDKIKVN